VSRPQRSDATQEMERAARIVLDDAEILEMLQAWKP
jgi:hypothetical protein